MIHLSGHSGPAMPSRGAQVHSRPPPCTGTGGTVIWAASSQGSCPLQVGQPWGKRSSWRGEVSITTQVYTSQMGAHHFGKKRPQVLWKEDPESRSSCCQLSPAPRSSLWSSLRVQSHLGAGLALLARHLQALVVPPVTRG